MKTEKIMLGSEVLKLKRKIFWIKVFQVLIAIAAFCVISWLFFVDVDPKRSFWEGVTKDNIWKFALFLAVIVLTYFVCLKWLSNKIRFFKQEMAIYTSRPQKIKKPSF